MVEKIKITILREKVTMLTKDIMLLRENHSDCKEKCILQNYSNWYVHDAYDLRR